MHSADAGTSRKATFCFRGASAELDTSAPLAPGEQILLHGGLRARVGGAVPSPSVIRITDRAVYVLRHFAFRGDRLLTIPPGAVRGISVDGHKVTLTWRDTERGEVVLRLTGWTGSNALAPALRDISVVAEALRQLAG